ncbi:MAG: diguanylate cyclase [Bacillota bacterium]|nr:diguanylate cyclase [Bacillota bacterium]
MTIDGDKSQPKGQSLQFGGDEFIIVLRKTSLDDAERKTVEIVRVFAEFNQIVTIAYGSVEVDSTSDVDECEMLRFLNAADQLMYDRKREMKERTRC